jgi:hypothetical protein
MSKGSLLVSASIILGCLILGLILGQPSSGQTPAPPATEPSPYFRVVNPRGGEPWQVPATKPGRYQVSASYGSPYLVVVCDTETGQCWVNQHLDKKWIDMGSPVPAKK